MADLVVRPSTKMLKVRYVLSLLLAGAVIVYGRYANLPIDILLIVPAAMILWTSVSHLSLHFITLRITKGKLLFEQGVLSRSSRSLELAKVQDIRVDQSIAQRMLNIGNLTLETAGETGRMAMLNIDRPREIADLILGAAREN
jgi:uncharacterized membrane protein YdbT with pleckstrin-like domain